MKDNKLEPEHSVVIMEGKDIDVKEELSFQGHVPDCKDFRFYYFKKSDKDKK